MRAEDTLRRMSRTRRASTAHALRVLAAPVPVLSLVVLVLNDHVLKQAWPGLVTGKLSDVAGLVVAPLLLSVLLAVVGVRTALPVAIGVTGLGFVFAKTSVAGAAATSAVWSLSGIPTLIRADVTDLVALPALGVAWWVDRRVRCIAREPWRQTVAMASGMALLPVAVLGTAATSCESGMHVSGVSLVEGDFPGRPRAQEPRLVISSAGLTGAFTVDAERTIERDPVLLSPRDVRVLEQCDPSNRAQCWRVIPDEEVDDGFRVGGVTVEHSSDGGLTWESDLDLSDDQLDEIREGTESCGDPGSVDAIDVGVLPTDGEPVVVVAVGDGGAFIRREDGQWELYVPDRLFGEAAPAKGDAVLRLRPLDQPNEPATPGEPTPGDGASGTTLACPSPTPTTVTPHPSNGPPTTYLACP